MARMTGHTDIISSGWISRVPLAVRPYLYLMRLDRPIGTWLLLIPALWVMLLANGLQSWPMILLFAVGAIIMRGAGCVINDIWDRDLDGRVERTATRPLPGGDITPRQAFLFLGFLLSCGLIILLQLNILTIALGVVSVGFVAVYPLMKRITWWPQLFLGLTFNFGALMGWTAVTGNLSFTPVLIYLAGIFWTLGYDTIYALQDRTDDALIGVKSSARYVMEQGWNIRSVIGVFYAVHIMLMAAGLWMGGISSLVLPLLAIPAMHLVWQVMTLNPDNPQNALIRFKSNRDYGLILCALIWAMS